MHIFIWVKNTETLFLWYWGSVTSLSGYSTNLKIIFLVTLAMDTYIITYTINLAIGLLISFIIYYFLYGCT